MMKILQTNQKPESLLTMKVTFSEEFQIFRELLILLAKADKNDLQTFSNKHSFKKVVDIIYCAIFTQCQLIAWPDDEQQLQHVLEGKIQITQPTQLTGKFVFNYRSSYEAISDCINKLFDK